jgi:hypothetical protein
MAYYTNYIGYKSANKQIGVIPFALILNTAIKALPLLVPWIASALKHPARDANKLIDSIKTQLSNSDPRQRLALVIATAQRISTAARDVAAEKLFLWYKNTYNEDYKALSIEDMEYYNSYLMSAINTQPDGNNFWYNSKKAMFTTSELNYNASLLQQASSNVSNIFSNLTQSPSKLILYGGIGLGLYLILKKQ